VLSINKEPPFFYSPFFWAHAPAITAEISTRDGNGAGRGRGIVPVTVPAHVPAPVPAPFPAAGKKFSPVPIPNGDLIPDGSLTGIFTRQFFLLL